ncbi:MAG: nitrous oxide reductase accessory protein NosL [Trueperaceae bacterium]
MSFDPDRPNPATTHLSTSPERLIDRRQVLQLGGVALAAALAGTVHAQEMMHQHGADHAMPGAMPGSPMAGGAGAGAADGPPPGPRPMGRPHAHAAPWGDATCAFCSMTIATPEGFPRGAGFRERTYAQWSFGAEARHFESIGCALSWAYAHGVSDGDGAALYVAGYDAPVAMNAAALLDARAATFLWAERLPTSMMARWGAFPDQGAAAAFAAVHERAVGPLGRRRFADLTFLQDQAPLPLMNLIPLLARAVGLVG